MLRPDRCQRVAWCRRETPAPQQATLPRHRLTTTSTTRRGATSQRRHQLRRLCQKRPTQAAMSPSRGSDAMGQRFTVTDAVIGQDAGQQHAGVPGLWFDQTCLWFVSLTQRRFWPVSQVCICFSIAAAWWRAVCLINSFSHQPTPSTVAPGQPATARRGCVCSCDRCLQPASHDASSGGRLCQGGRGHRSGECAAAHAHCDLQGAHEVQRQRWLHHTVSDALYAARKGRNCMPAPTQHVPRSSKQQLR